MTDCLHESNAQIYRECRVGSGIRLQQVRSAPAQTLASCHATARRMLDDMKRGVIYARIPASVRLAASAGLCCAFRCTASSARWLVAGHHVSDAFHVEPFSRVPTRGMLPNSSGSMTGGALSRVLRLPCGRSQSSSTISSWQGYPANAFYNVRGCAGFGRSIMNESGPTTFPVVDTFPRKPVLLCGRFIGPRAMGRRNGVEAVVSEPARNNGL